MTIEKARKGIEAMRDDAQLQLEATKTDDQCRLENLIDNLTELLKELEGPEQASDGWTACTPKDIEQERPSKRKRRALNKANPNIEYPTCPKCLSTRVLMASDGIRYCADCDAKHIWTAVEVPPGFLEAVGDTAPRSKKPVKEPAPPECDHRNTKTDMCDDGIPCKATWLGCDHYTPLGSPFKPLIDPALTAKGEALMCPACRSLLTYPSVERDGEFWCGDCDTYVPAHAAIVKPKDKAPAQPASDIISAHPQVPPEVLVVEKAYGTIPVPIRTDVCTALINEIFGHDSVTWFRAKPLLAMIRKLYPKLKPRSCESVLSAYMAFLVVNNVVERVGVGTGTKYRRGLLTRGMALDKLGA